MNPTRPTALLLALAASALSFTLALAPMSAHATPTVDAAMAACKTAWEAQPGAGKLDAVRMDRFDDAGRKIKLDLRAKGVAGSKVKIKCTLDETGKVIALGNTPVVQLADGTSK
jgi:hypothetical protein